MPTICQHLEKTAAVRLPFGMGRGGMYWAGNKVRKTPVVSGEVPADATWKKRRRQIFRASLPPQG